MGARPSLYPDDRTCFVCGSPHVEQHHVYKGSRRPISDREGCTVWLCHAHHQNHRVGVHYDREFDDWLRADCQRRWEQREMDEAGIGQDEARERFGSRFYESYL